MPLKTLGKKPLVRDDGHPHALVAQLDRAHGYEP